MREKRGTATCTYCFYMSRCRCKFTQVHMPYMHHSHVPPFMISFMYSILRPVTCYGYCTNARRRTASRATIRAFGEFTGGPQLSVCPGVDVACEDIVFNSTSSYFSDLFGLQCDRNPQTPSSLEALNSFMASSGFIFERYEVR